MTFSARSVRLGENGVSFSNPKFNMCLKLTGIDLCHDGGDASVAAVESLNSKPLV